MKTYTYEDLVARREELSALIAVFEQHTEQALRDELEGVEFLLWDTHEPPC